MNKRSFIFVILLTLTLLFVHQWFNKKDESAVSQETVQNKEQQLLAEQSQEKPIPLSQLPIVKLYSDAAGEQFISYAVRIHDQYLTFAWSDELPQYLYAQKLVKGSVIFEQTELRIKSNKGSPILYSGNFGQPLPIAYLPDIGSSSLQFVEFSKEGKQPSIMTGILERDELIFANGAPKTDAIVLYKFNNEYLPYGIYRTAKLRIEPLDNIPNFGTISSPVFPDVPSSAKEREEKFFVLENDYQQLVFSSFGAALVEINLPIKSEAHPNSVILETDLDRIMKKDFSNNDYFPACPCRYGETEKKDKTIPVMGDVGGYYPLLRRSIRGASDHITTPVPPHYYALNIVSGEEHGFTTYTMKRITKNLIEFEAIEPTRRITKTYSFPEDPSTAPYTFELSIKIDGDVKGLRLTSGVPEVELVSGSFSPSLKYRVVNRQKSKVEQLDLPKNKNSYTSILPNWISNSNSFFGIIIESLTGTDPGFSTVRIPGQIVPTRLSLVDAPYKLYPLQDYPGYEFHLHLRATNEVESFRVFAGPYATEVLKRVDMTYENPVTGYTPDFLGAVSFHGWFAFISEPFAKFLFFLMKLFHSLTNSWGISIILLTLALRIMLYPLNSWSIRSTQRMQEIAPKVSAIQEKFKKDPKRSQMEIMNLYREKGVNPLTGCLPILIQIPFLIGMFDLLKTTFELRGASFIPGWINDLSAPDVIFSWGYPLFFIGNSLHLLPLILGGVMYFQQKLSSPLPKDKNLWTDQQKQSRMMGSIMTIVFTVMFYKFPSGLNIYWLSSMLLGILQQWWMTRKPAVQKSGPVIVQKK